MRILMLNWRDIRHPRAGGAERVTYEMLRRWVEWGHQVTWFAASFPGGASRECIDGIDVWRAGNQMTVHLQAYLHYRRHFAGHVDVIVDQVNTIPFLTPLYAREPVVLFMHQIAHEVWWYEAPFPVNAIGYVAEPFYLQAYRHTPAIVMSASLQHDLQRWGLRGPFTICPEAVDTTPLQVLSPMSDKSPHLSLVYVGRVVPSKRVDHIIQALALLRTTHLLDVSLTVVGSADEAYLRKLRALAARCGVAENVSWLGRVPYEDKVQMMERAHLIVMASVREGWGLVVSEAAARGTPAVVYNVAGLRDAVMNGAAGAMATGNTPTGLATAIADLLGDSRQYDCVRFKGWRVSQSMSWDTTAHTSWQAVQHSTGRTQDNIYVSQ